jgi:hypothetical protein
MAESLQTADPAAFDGLPVPLVEVAAAQFLVGGPAREQVIDDAEDGVADGHRRPPLPAARRQSPLLGREIGRLGPPGRLPGLHQQRP